MNFEFATATKILFGQGSIAEAASNARAFGKCTMVVCGRNIDRAEKLFHQFKAMKVDAIPFQVSSEPDISLVNGGVNLARQKKCDFVIGFGGGSVLDTGKVIAAMLTNPGDLMDYLEVIGKGQKIKQRSAPYTAIPTTAGTGAEVTQNAVLSSPEHRVKVSMRSPLMLPMLAIVDPELTYSMPPEVTASTGLDALTQLIEAFVSRKSNPLTDGICREGIMRAARSLRRAYVNGNDREEREDMCVASLFSGLVLANAGLGAVHGLAGPIGGMFPAPHGAICARLLPFVMETNIRNLQSQYQGSPVLIRYHEIARIVTGNFSAHIEDGLEWVQRLCAELNVPGLSKFGLAPKDISLVVEKAQQASSMKGNPARLPNEILTEILRAAL